MAFNQAIRNPEIAFADLTTDTVSAMAQEGDFSQAVFTDAKGSSADLSKVTEKGDNRAVRVEGAGRIQTEGKILYTTEAVPWMENRWYRLPRMGSAILFSSRRKRERGKSDGKDNGKNRGSCQDKRLCVPGV